ncbi:hypothetical protein D3C71_1629890 [compost metagenome]
MSAGWSCYCWLLGNRPDHEFDESKLAQMLELVKNTIHTAPDRAKYSMSNFIFTVATSYTPLHDKAVEIAEAVGQVEVNNSNKKSSFIHALPNIQKEISRGRIGFKRKHVRC